MFSQKVDILRHLFLVSPCDVINDTEKRFMRFSFRQHPLLCFGFLFKSQKSNCYQAIYNPVDRHYPPPF